MRKWIRKKDGTVVPFRKGNVVNSIVKAFKEVNPERGEAIAIDTARFIYSISIKPWVIEQKERQMGYKEVRRVVERAVMVHSPRVARAYVIYGYLKSIDKLDVFDVERIKDYES